MSRIEGAGRQPYHLFSCGLPEDRRFGNRLAAILQRPVDHVTDLKTLGDIADRFASQPVIFLISPEDEVVLEAIRITASRTAHPPLIAVGPAHDAGGAIHAIQAGADGYFSADEIQSLAAELSEKGPLRDTNSSRAEQIEHAFGAFITCDPHMHALFRTVHAISRSSASVLVTGETGVGKELLAAGIHRASGRAGEFVAENVAGLDDALFSDALFGHRRGAFTGAIADRQGLVDRASNGTLFLDEIGDITPFSQMKLLRTLENRTYHPVGSDEPSQSSARVVLATNRDLLELAKRGEFRLDLFFRLAAFHFQIPPLRHRRCDIRLLVEHFAEHMAEELSIRRPRFPPSLIGVLESYDYPGNVRELQSVVVALVSRGRDGRLGDDAPTCLARSILRRHSSAEITTLSPVSFPETLPTIEELTDQLIGEALRRTDGNQSAAARMLGISASAVSKRLYRRRESVPDSEL